MALSIRGSAFYFGDPAQSPRASFSSFYDWIRSKGNDLHWPYIPKDAECEVKRRLFCEQNATHFYGVFLSARNAQFQHFVKQEGNKVIVEAKSTGGNPPVEMNFFALRLDSGKGIFSHYQGSYRFLQFLHDLWSSYRHFVDEMRQLHKAELIANKEKKQTAKQYSLRGRSNYSPLFTPGEFDKLCERLESISEVRATTYKVDSKEDHPVSRILQSVHRVYRLTDAPPDAKLLAWLKKLRGKTTRKLASGLQTHSGSVLGTETGGQPLCISFENTLEDYLDYEYDEIGSLAIDNLSAHPIIKDIIDQTTGALLFAPTVKKP